MKFSEIISATRIVLDLKSQDRWSAIDELVDCLVSRQLLKIEYRDSVLEAVKGREKTISTGIGFGIAIPHASTPSIDKVTAILGRSSQGINFEALDNQPVRLVLMFLVPAGQYQQHLKTLSTISRFLSDREFREQAEKAMSAEELYEVIVKKDQ